MKAKYAITGILAASIVLTGCSGILSSEQPSRQIYLLDPIELTSTGTPEAPSPTLSFSLVAVPGLDTDRILALNDDARITPYANARWPDFLPEVLDSVIRRSLLSTDNFAAISPDAVSTGLEWALTMEAQQFFGLQEIEGSTSRVNAKFDALLSCNGETHRLQLESSRPVGEERLSVVVRAHQDALNDVTRDLWEAMQSQCQ